MAQWNSLTHSERKTLQLQAQLAASPELAPELLVKKQNGKLLIFYLAARAGKRKCLWWQMSGYFQASQTPHTLLHKGEFKADSS